jgi:hypothetical protein
MVPDHQKILYVAREPSRNRQVPFVTTLVAMQEAVELTQVPGRVSEANTRGRSVVLPIYISG